MPKSQEIELMEALEATPFFSDLASETLELLSGSTKLVSFEAGQFLFREGQPADDFFIILQGRVAIELRTTGRGQVIIQTLEENDIVGFGWVHPPQRWIFDAQSLTFLQALSVNVEGLMDICRKDHSFGFDIMQNLVGSVVDQLQATRLQVLEFYGVRG